MNTTPDISVLLDWYRHPHRSSQDPALIINL